MWEAKYLKKSANHRWKSKENHQKLLFFFICPSLEPHKIQKKRDNWNFQKQASLLVFWLQFVFSNNHSKSTGSPLREAEVKAVKVVNFVAMWLNLYPRTVTNQVKNKVWSSSSDFHSTIFYSLFFRSSMGLVLPAAFSLASILFAVVRIIFVLLLYHK